jgi:hypothetical protein
LPPVKDGRFRVNFIFLSHSVLRTWNNFRRYWPFSQKVAVSEKKSLMSLFVLARMASFFGNIQSNSVMTTLKGLNILWRYKRVLL